MMFYTTKPVERVVIFLMLSTKLDYSVYSYSGYEELQEACLTQPQHCPPAVDLL